MYHPNPTSQINIINANNIGFRPNPLIFSKLVSTPRANIASVNNKTSNSTMPDITCAGINFKELIPHITTNRIANQGIGTFVLSVLDFLAKYQPSINKYGTNIITRVSFTITAVSVTEGDIALPAATTWATSWTVEPIYIPKTFSGKIPHLNNTGYKNIAAVPNKTTVETANDTLWDFAFNIESVPNTAAAPQTDEPIAVNIHKSLSNLKTLVPR